MDGHVMQPFKKKLEKRFKVDEFKSLYTFYYSGLNVRSTDFNANLGIEQLKKLEDFKNKTQKF